VVEKFAKVKKIHLKNAVMIMLGFGGFIVVVSLLFLKKKGNKNFQITIINNCNLIYTQFNI